jgi:hypothetical protein
LVKPHVFRSIGFEITCGLLLDKMRDVAIHQCRADSLSL